MIRLKSVEIDGFITPTQKVKLEFVDSNVICIYGDNGSGKTTFLEILYAVFDRDEDILERYMVNKISINYKIFDEELEHQIKELEEELNNKNFAKRIDDLSKDLDNCQNSNCEDQIKYSIKEVELEEYGIKVEIKKIKDKLNSIKIVSINKVSTKNYNFDGFDDITSLYLGIGRGIHKQEIKIPRSLIWGFFNTNKNDEKNNEILTAHKIDEFTDKLLEWITPESVISEEIKEEDNKKNIYLPNITIDRVESLLIKKYKEAVLDAKKNIEKALSKTSLNFLKNTDRTIEIDLEDLRERLIYNRILLLEMFSKDEEIGIKSLLDSVDNDSDYLKTIGYSQQKILKTIVDKLQSEVELYKEIRVFIDEYNSFLNYDKKIIINENGIFIAPNNHRLEKLSSGERHLLTFFATILLLGEEQDFILLDEPEVSLNVDWQRKILSTIAKLAPNSQIIIATHSPLIGRSYRKSVVGLEPKVIDYEE